MSEDSGRNLGPYTIGDRFPFPYFVFTEDEFNTDLRAFKEGDLDPSDYAHIKFCARSDKNMSSVDDHSNDDIYRDLNHIDGPVYRYQWQVDDIDKFGRWTVRLEFERTDGTKFHSPHSWFFYVERKMEGAFGDH